MAKNIISVILAGDARGVIDASRDAKRALGEVETKSKTTGEKLGGYAKAAVAGIAGVAVAAGAYAVKVGGELGESQDVIGGALKNTHQKMADLVANGYGPLLKQNEKWGNTNADVNNSLASLIRTGDSAKKAITDQALAANLAAFKHIDLASATDQVIKSNAGATRIYKSMGIELRDVNGKVKSQTELHKELAAKLNGTASTAAEGFQGKMRAMHAQLTDVAAKVGLVLIPIIIKLANFLVDDVVPAVAEVTHWVETKLIPALSRFKPFVSAMISEIRGIVTAVSGVFKLVNDLIHGKWSKLWGDAKQIVSGVITAIEGWFAGLPKHLLGLVGNIGSAALSMGKAIASGILHGITGAAGDVANFAKSIVNSLIGYVNRDIIDKIDRAIGDVSISVFGHHIGLPKHVIPNIPTLHAGGVFNSGFGEGLALLQDGERVLSRSETARGGVSGGNTYMNFHAPMTPSQVEVARRRYSRYIGATA